MVDFLNTILDLLQDVFHKFRVFLPNLVAMLLIIIGGFIFAWFVKFILMKFLKAIHFDQWSDRMGFTAMMRKGDIWTKPSVTFGKTIFWLLNIIILMTGLSALNFAAIDSLVEDFFNYLPRVFSAAIILLLGFLISSFINRAVLIAAANAGFHYARLLAQTIRVLLMLMFLAMAMEQLQIAPGIVLAAFSIIFGGIVAALSISFGVGGIATAKKIIEKQNTKKQTEKSKDDMEHL